MAFTPGAAASLTSLDGRVRLQVPPGLFGRALTLRQRTLLDARTDLSQQGRPLPPRFVGAHRALPPFVLDATAAAGADIHQFDAPQARVGSGKALLMPPLGGLAQSGAPIKSITFEGGSLLDATTGVDSTAGTVNLETSAPLKGSYSATIPNNSTGNLTENFSGVDDFYS